MIILIPIGGVGKRFKEKGYELPKSLINVCGKSIIFHLLDNLNIKSEKVSKNLSIVRRFCYALNKRTLGSYC